MLNLPCHIHHISTSGNWKKKEKKENLLRNFILVQNMSVFDDKTVTTFMKSNFFYKNTDVEL
jgi:hypothetical protein